MEANGIPHEPWQCKCGSDPIEESPDGPLCDCKCHECCMRRDQVVYYWRRAALEKRLQAAKIDLDLLADLIWMRIEQTIEARTEKIAKESIKRALQGIKLTSIVEEW